MLSPGLPDFRQRSTEQPPPDRHDNNNQKHNNDVTEQSLLYHYASCGTCINICGIVIDLIRIFCTPIERRKRPH